MAILGGLFGKKKELSGEDLDVLFTSLAGNRDPVVVRTPMFKYTSDVLEVEDGIFHVRNTLNRDEVMYQLKGQQLQLNVPYELTHYKGETMLRGLGMIKNMHTLKFSVPESLSKDESRRSVRINSFPVTPRVTFTTDEFQLAKGKLMDISMTGAGIKPDPKWIAGDNKLSPRQTILVDIKIPNELELSTSAEVRHFAPAKMGLLFQDLSKAHKQQLFKFIVARRKEEQRIGMEMERKAYEESKRVEAGDSKPEVVEAAVKRESSRPTVLIAGDNQEWCDFLGNALGRKFNVLHCPFSVTDIRNNLELHPSVTMLEIDSHDLAHVSQIKKIGSLVLGESVLLYFGEGFDSDFRDRFRGHDPADQILVDLTGRKVLSTFRQVDTYFLKKGPQIKA